MELTEDKVKELTEDQVKELVAMFEGIIDNIRVQFEKLVDVLSTALNAAWNYIKEDVCKVWEAVKYFDQRAKVNNWRKMHGYPLIRKAHLSNQWR